MPQFEMPQTKLLIEHDEFRGGRSFDSPPVLCSSTVDALRGNANLHLNARSGQEKSGIVLRAIEYHSH